MSNIDREELPDLWSRSLISTEIAIFHMIRTLLILTIAIRKRGEDTDRLLKLSRQDLMGWLKTLAEMQKNLLKKLDLYRHFLDPNEWQKLTQLAKGDKNQKAREQKIQFYTSSIMTCFYGSSYPEEMGFHLSEVNQDFIKYDVQKNHLFKSND